MPTQHATPWSAIPSTGVAYPQAAPSSPSRSGTGASGSPAGDREGKKKKGLFGWGGDPDKKRAEKEARAREEVERRAEKERAKEEAKAQERAMAEAHARVLAEKAERERLEREAREREAEAARLEHEAAGERRRNLPQTSESPVATLCEREAAAAAAVACLRPGGEDGRGRHAHRDARGDRAALGAMRERGAAPVLDALGSASDTGLQASARPPPPPSTAYPLPPPPPPPPRPPPPPSTGQPHRRRPPSLWQEALLGLLSLIYGEGASQADAPAASGGLPTYPNPNPNPDPALTLTLTRTLTLTLSLTSTPTPTRRPLLPHRAALAPRVAPAARGPSSCSPRSARTRRRRLPADLGGIPPPRGHGDGRARASPRSGCA